MRADPDAHDIGMTSTRRSMPQAHSRTSGRSPCPAAALFASGVHHHRIDADPTRRGGRSRNGGSARAGGHGRHDHGGVLVLAGANTAGSGGFVVSPQGDTQAAGAGGDRHINDQGRHRRPTSQACLREFDSSTSSPTTETAVCTSFTQDDEVFAVIAARPAHQRGALLLPEGRDYVPRRLASRSAVLDLHGISRRTTGRRTRCPRLATKS